MTTSQEVGNVPSVIGVQRELIPALCQNRRWICL